MKILEFKKTAMLSPGTENARNSEGAFIKLDDERIAFVYSRYNSDSFKDSGSCDICAIYSDDNGNTWDTDNYETIVSASEYNAENVMSASLIRMNNDDIGLFYIIKEAKGNTSYMLRRYKGDFSNFLSETKCFPNNYKCYYVVNNDRVLRMKDGKLLVPAAYHHTNVSDFESEDIDVDEHWDMRAIVHFFTSSDDGRTWKENFETLRLPDTHSNSGLQEPGAVELKDGIIYSWARTDRMFQYEAISADGGEHWIGPQASKFTSHISPMQIKKNPYSGKFYAIWNPVPCYDYINVNVAMASLGRTPIVIAESDDGVNFEKPYILEDDITKGYCYPAMYFLDEKTMLIAYCDGGSDVGMTLKRTSVHKLVIE